MRIALVTPARPGARSGNRHTALRWASFLRAAGHQVTLSQRWRPDPGTGMMLALHARRSHESMRAFHAMFPARPLLLALTGTDIYRDIRISAQAQASLAMAHAFVVLQPEAIRAGHGLSTLCGLIIAVAGGRMALGLGPWVPQRWLGRALPGSQLGKVFAVGARLMRRCERVIKPRGLWLSAHPWTQRVSGCAIALCGLLLAAPAPPGTALPPAAAILLLSVGTLEEDLLFLAAGYVALALNILFFGAIAFLGWGGVRALLR